MTNVREYNHIDTFLGPGGSKTDKIESCLEKLKISELEQINEALSFVDHDHDPIGDWRNQLAADKPTTMFSELILMRHFRCELGTNAVELNATIPDSTKDFDLRVEWENTTFWIEIRKPDFADRLDEQVGFISWDWTPDSIMRKFQRDFEPARLNIPDGDVLVLALYLEAMTPQQTAIQRWLGRTGENPEEFADAFIEYTHLTDTTSLFLRELTERGECVSTLIDEIVE